MLAQLLKWAFFSTPLVRINIPPNVRTIKRGAFEDCSNLTTAILGDGLEEIGKWAFCGTSLERIVIPPAVRTIHAKAFAYCSN